jgi:hypothetical protein
MKVEFLGQMLVGVTTMTTIDLERSFFRAPKKMVALAALWTLLASFTGNALVEQTEKHALEDRLVRHNGGPVHPCCVLALAFRVRLIRTVDESGI